MSTARTVEYSVVQAWRGNVRHEHVIYRSFDEAADEWAFHAGLYPTEIITVVAREVITGEWEPVDANMS